MAPNPIIMQAVEQMGYRVTVGDVATKAGLNINLAERGLLALASDAGGHLQVAETGDVVYLFPQNFRTIIRNKYLQIQLKEWWEKIWRVLFYLIRISFGIVLLLSIALIFLSIFLIITATNQDGDSRSEGSHSGGGMIFMPRFWFGPDWFWFLYWDYDNPRRQYERRQSTDEGNQMHFLEVVFSFLFGDGNPNADLEKRRWQAIGTIIRNNRGAVIAEQIAPYLDDTGTGYANEYEEYMLPVLSRFNGRPEVSPEGQLVYHFPELQTTAKEQQTQPVQAYLREWLWRFSQASSGQLMLAIGLGAVNFVGALVLGSLLASGTAAKLGGFVAFAASIYGVLLAYGIGFLAVPLGRYFWIQWKNRKIEARNQIRQERVGILNQPDAELQKKLAFAQQFAAQSIIGHEDLAYTTETDLIEQEIEQTSKLDAEWQRRLNSEE
ncbi:hypothetical protein [Microcoleus sp. FACHB-672]|uniref:hypothetical protein n=1 Tax=Microcoleus sp. FACHB-672 TaxID=2692825 RepID=UPI0016824C59|nr:hypothetical protein [Microcoleus sp. FACHB-672]MBD2041767.1 hypothetical protein [Microcoleus sp. FACHB-672]